MHVVGIDVSKDKLDCLWLRDPEQLKVKTKVLANTVKGHAALSQWLLSNLKVEPEAIHVVMEATGVYHEALAYALHREGFLVSVVNPRFIKAYGDSLGARNKTDKKDSLVIARYGYANRPALWQPEPEEIRELKALIVRLEAVCKDLQREQNRLEKSQISQASTAVIESTERVIDELRKEKERLEKMIDDHINRHPGLKRDKALLKSIPAIGDVLCREMLALLRSREFRSGQQASAFVGVIPRLMESGKFKGQSRLAKNGPGRIRAKLYMGAVVAKTHNPDIRSQYERLRARGKTKMQALGAAMRKLVQICFGVLKSQSEYRPQVA